MRATRAIAKDEEILMPYRLPNAVNATTQAELQQIWGFKCNCGICIAEAASTSVQRKQRVQLIEKATALLSLRPSSSAAAKDQYTPARTAQVEKLATQLSRTYDERHFAQKPRLGLIALDAWLCKAYKHQASHAKALEAAVALLRDLGFCITFDAAGQPVGEVERQHCLVESRAVDAALYAAGALRAGGQGDEEAALRMEELAKSLWIALYGDMRGFEGRLGEG